MINEVVKDCNALGEKTEHERFGYDAPDYDETTSNSKSSILEICSNYKVYLQTISA